MTTKKRVRGPKVYHKITLDLISEYTGIKKTTLLNKQNRREVDFSDFKSCLNFMWSYKTIKDIAKINQDQ